VSKLRVLVVDDSVTIRAILSSLIERDRGSQIVGVASDVEEARELIASCVPDVVTLDLEMPGVDGWTFLDELKSSTGAPIVVLSSLTSAGSPAEQDVLARGAAACFDKALLIKQAKDLLRLLKDVALAHQRERLSGMEHKVRWL
jgi:two-component system chemotaxis response regulator CheB